MKILDENVKLRRENHFFYKEIFKNIVGVELFEVLNEDYFSNYWLNTILIEATIFESRNKERLRLAFEEKNIETRPLRKPMHLQPIFEKYPYYGNKIAENLFEKGLCLPSGSNLTSDDKNRIKQVIVDLFN